METILTPDSLSTGLETTPMMDQPIPALRVSWIKWDSGLRGTQLAVGDRIIAVNGTRLTRPADAPSQQRLVPRLLGQYEESQAWREAGAQEGQAVTLRVRRRNVPGHGWSEIDIRGELRSGRSYIDSDGRRFIGPGGPDEMESDGFDSSWSSWYEQVVRQWTGVLDQGPWIGPVITDPAMAEHLRDKDRVALLSQKYPGPFGAAVSADFESVTRRIAGRTYPVAPGDLDYRELGEKRKQQVADAGRAARAAFLEKHTAEMIPAFPAIDHILGNRSAVVSKLVELPPITSREWIEQGPRTWFVFGDGNRYYFAEGEGAAMQQALIAERRYEALVSPDIQANYAVIGRILPEPALVVVNEQGCFGLKAEPAAMSIGDAFFIDLSSPQALFAGEEQLATFNFPPPPDNAPPEAVMASSFGALKAGDEKLWGSLYADWNVFIADNGLPIINPGIPPSLESPWTDARREILDRVADVRVVWTDDARTVVTGKEFGGAPVIEETMVEVDHLRVQDKVFHAFAATGFTRYWTLQRMNSGPWRITNNEGI